MDHPARTVLHIMYGFVQQNPQSHHRLLLDECCKLSLFLFIWCIYSPMCEFTQCEGPQ